MSLAFCQCGSIKGRCKCVAPTMVKVQTTTERGYGWDWQVLSKRYRLENPLCERCYEQGRTKPAIHVHHKIPIAIDRSRRLDLSNLMAVCVECHEEIENMKVTAEYER